MIAKSDSRESVLQVKQVKETIKSNTSMIQQER